LKTREEVAHFPFLRKKVLEAPWLVKIRFLRPVKGELVQESRVPTVAPNLEEMLLEALVGLLEKCQQNPPLNVVEANTQLLAWALRFEKV